MEKPQTLIMVIFGASGDLTRRKLMPALYVLHRLGRLPEKLILLGVARTLFDEDSFRDRIRQALLLYVKSEEIEPHLLDSFLERVYYLPMDPADAAQYSRLRTTLATWDAELGNPGNYLYYLATPPLLYGVIPQHLKAAGLNGRTGPGQVRIVVEKPFGYDLESARQLTAVYRDVFEEEQIYRIDHFLGKETVQNILAFRFANSLFEPLWNRNYIDYMEITAVENMGVGTRGASFDGVGTLRDMVQNHLAQLLAVTVMEPPSSFNADDFRNEVVKVYRSLAPLTQEDMRRFVVRGQYTASPGRKAYREEDHVDKASRTETFLAMRIGVDNWRWSGVPIYIRTGKQMPTKVTEVVVHFKPAPFAMFGCEEGGCPVTNRLVIRIQPGEGIALRFGMKTPGSGFRVSPMDMDFSYAELGALPTEDAYARLIEDCMAGDPTLFIRSDAVEAGWRFFDPLVRFWREHPAWPLYGYPAGTWGPPESERLLAGRASGWTNPCKNLTQTDLYCEL